MNTLEQSNQRIAELEADLQEINLILCDAGIEHSGYKKQAPRVKMLIERERGRIEMLKLFSNQRNTHRKQLEEIKTGIARWFGLMEDIASRGEPIHVARKTGIEFAISQIWYFTGLNKEDLQS